MSTPGQVADGHLADLETQYQAARAAYDTKVSAALTLTTQSEIKKATAEILVAKQAMISLLSQMVSVTTQDPTPNLEEKRKQLIKRLHELQQHYNELSASDDQLKTLERIRAREEEKFEGPFYLLGGLFALACAALVASVIARGTQ